MLATRQERRPRGMVLVVEDDPDYSDLLNTAFSDSGFRTLQAVNGERALNALRSEDVDLVVSDFMMPELNGLELCRLMNGDARLSEIKVVLYSANNDQVFRKKARELGALDYLQKSDDTAALVAQICRLAGVSGEQRRSPAPGELTGKLEESLRTISDNAGQLNLLFENLLDLLQLSSIPEQQPQAIRMAVEAAQRTGSDIKRILSEMQKTSRELIGMTKAA